MFRGGESQADMEEITAIDECTQLLHQLSYEDLFEIRGNKAACDILIEHGLGATNGIILPKVIGELDSSELSVILQAHLLL